jgi:hypothetical protein
MQPEPIEGHESKRRAPGVRWRDDKGRYVTKLNEATIARVGEAIRVGMSWEGVAARIGIGDQTLLAWRREAAREDASPLFQQLHEEIEAALSDFELTANKRIQDAGRETWQANAWLLERRWPERYGRRARLDVGNPEGEVFRVLAGQFDIGLLDDFTPEELEAFKQFLTRLMPSQPDNVIDMPIRRQIEA